MRALGRIGQPLTGGTYRPRRRLRAPRWLLIALSISLVAVVWVAVTANRQVGAEPPASIAAGQIPARPAGVDQVSRSGRVAQAGSLALADGLQMTVPHRKPLLIAFSEANFVEALALTPTGRLAGNGNPTNFTAPPDVEGPDYRVLPSRGQSRPATSAVNVVVPLGDDIVAPVSGTVTSVTEYPLYGNVRDWRVEIRPDGREDLAVVLVHLLKPRVRVGDTVAAGRTPIGVARLLPVRSPVDAFTDGEHPHTHIEVKPAVAAEPIDPNQPATPADGEPTTAP